MQDSYYSCGAIDSSHLVVDARIDQGGNVLSLCCEWLADIPKCSFDGTPEEILKGFISMRALALETGKYSVFDSPCKKCAAYQKANWSGGDGKVHYVNLSMYPAPCQCRCVYCHKARDPGWINGIENEFAQAAYEKLFAVLKLADDIGLIAPDAAWQVASGEITIHPYRERIMELVQGKNVRFFTNCFKYDEDIAQALHNNPGSAINLSIDAGTAETWRKVKGFNNFDAVVSNLEKYGEQSIHPKQITLKYIILPGLNDTMEDYMGLMEIMGKLNVRKLEVSRDLGTKYCAGDGGGAELLRAASSLLAVCQKHGISCDMGFAYTPAERDQAEITAQAYGKDGRTAMDKTAKVSIYTSVYNVKPFLRQCVESVLNQTYTDFEYFLIDNGCTDGSEDILREYAAKDSRIRLIRNEENQGAMFWLGILEKQGDGEWMAVLDSDDWIEPDFLERLLAFAEENDLDIACTGSSVNDEDSVETGFWVKRNETKVFTCEEFSTAFPEYFDPFHTWWGKLVRMELARNIRKKPKHMGTGYGIDVLYAFEWLRNARRVGLDASVLHHYRVRRGSVLRAYDPERFDVGAYVVHELTAFLEEFGPLLPENQNLLDSFYAENIQGVSDLIMGSDLSIADKLKEMQRILDHPTTQDILQRRVAVPMATIKSGFFAIITPNTFSPEETQEMRECFCTFVRVLSPNCSAAVTLQNAGLFLADRSRLRERIGDDALQKFYIEHHRTFLLFFGSRTPLRFFPGNSTPLLQSIIQDDPEELVRRLKQLARNKRLAAQYDLPAAIQVLQFNGRA